MNDTQTFHFVGFLFSFVQSVLPQIMMFLLSETYLLMYCKKHISAVISSEFRRRTALEIYKFANKVITISIAHLLGNFIDFFIRCDQELYCLIHSGFCQIILKRHVMRSSKELPQIGTVDKKLFPQTL